MNDAPATPRRLLAIDPGTTESGVVLVEGIRILSAAVLDNHDVRQCLQARDYDDVAIEWMQSMGMSVGQEVFVTIRWIGRFTEASRDPEAVRFIPRGKIKHHICGSSRAKDANIRLALIDMLGPVGTKREPGPLRGVTSHAWSALAVAMTALGVTPESASLARRALGG